MCLLLLPRSFVQSRRNDLQINPTLNLYDQKPATRGCVDGNGNNRQSHSRIRTHWWREHQTQVFWYLPVICGGPLKVPWDHRRRLLCFDESPLSTNIYPADLFWPCLCRREDYHNTRCPVWSSKPLTNETCGRHDRQLLPSVIIIRQSTRQRSLV